MIIAKNNNNNKTAGRRGSGERIMGIYRIERRELLPLQWGRQFDHSPLFKNRRVHVASADTVTRRLLSANLVYKPRKINKYKSTLSTVNPLGRRMKFRIEKPAENR